MQRRKCGARIQFGRGMMNRMGQPEEVAAADIAVDGGIRAW